MAEERKDAVDVGIEVARIGLGVVLDYLLRRDDTRAYLLKLVAEGRQAPTLEEVAAMNARGDTIHSDLGDAIARREREGS